MLVPGLIPAFRGSKGVSRNNIPCLGGNGLLQWSPEVVPCSHTVAHSQLLPPALHRDGSIYVTRCSVIMHKYTLFGMRTLGYEVDRSNAVNIDMAVDWHRAEVMMHEFVS